MAHNSLQDWPELPLFTAREWVVTDDDIEAWQDIYYMRGLVDSILILCSHTGHTPELGPPEVEFDSQVYLEPWTDDDPAAAALDTWATQLATQRIELAA